MSKTINIVIPVKENNMPVISIIVPVYNVEKYLHRCIDSILAQTFPDFECILIDDGSPDNCPAICDEYAEKDGRIIVIHQKNAGVSAARNTGLDKASGEWIGFVDSDDWLEPNALGKLYNKQRETNADIVTGRYRNIYNNSKKTAVSKFENKFKNNLVDLFMNNNIKMLWGKLYRKILFDGYIVPSENMAEDLFVNVQILSKPEFKKLHKIDDVIYNYDRRTGITSAKNIELYNSLEDFPSYRMFKTIGKYLNIQSEQNQDIVSGYKIMFFTRIIVPYMRSNKKLPYKEIKDFYYTYYYKCKYRVYAPLYMRVSILFLFYFGRLRCLVWSHFWIMNFVKIMKNKILN